MTVSKMTGPKTMRTSVTSLMALKMVRMMVDIRRKDDQDYDRVCARQIYVMVCSPSRRTTKAGPIFQPHSGSPVSIQPRTS